MLEEALSDSSRSLDISAADERTGTDGGMLILIVGPSGSGKDTLLNAARQHFGGDNRFFFARRVITRTGQLGEKHEAVNEAEFKRIAAEGGFFLSWHAHGLHYGVTGEVLRQLCLGKSVIVNASRQILDEACRRWPKCRVIHIGAHEDVLRERLSARARESGEEIEERIQRASAFEVPAGDAVIRIDNSGTLADGVTRFIEALERSVQR